MSIFTINTEQLAAVKQEVLDAKKIVLSTHINPDGDAIGSSMGLLLALRSLGKSVEAIIPNAMPSFISWMDKEDVLVNYEKDEKRANELILEADLVFCLDYNTLSRVDKMGEVIKNAPAKKVLIDHHQAPDDFDFMFSDVKTSSTCEMVYEFLCAMEWDKYLNTPAAECLYTGIMTDTGSFRYRGTSANTFKVASNLVHLGVDPGNINELVNNASSLDRLKLTGYAINNRLEILEDKGIAFIYLSEEDLAKHDYQPGDTDGLVNMALGVDVVNMSVLFKESPGKIKISFRSKGDISVNDFARKYFAGGGHTNAAGGVSFSKWEETKEKFLNAVDETF